MTRTDELFSMTGRTLIQLADKLGVKVACNKTRTQLKEKKDNVVERILEVEKQISDKKAEKQIEVKAEKVVEEATLSNETEHTQTIEEIQQSEAKAEEAVKKVKADKSKKSSVRSEDIEELSKYVFKCLKDLDCTIKKSTNNQYVFKVDGHTFAKFRCGRTITFQLCSDAIKDIDVNYHTINVKFNAVIKFTEYTVENKEIIWKLLVTCRDYQLNKKLKNSNKEEQ